MRTQSQYLNIKLLLTILLCLSVNCYFFSGNELRDLESNTTYFSTEILNWTVTNRLTTSNASQCGGTWLLGGYGIVGDGGTYIRTYSSLPAHNMIYFSMDVYFIDLLELADLFKMMFDNALVQTYTSTFGSAFTSMPNTQLCGGSRTDYYSVNVRGQASHNSTTLQIKLYSLATAASNYFSVGFRNLRLQFQLTSSPATSACAINDLTSSTSSCLCSKGQYDPPGLSGCATCSTNCETCSGSSAANCTSCATGYSYNGNTCFQCHSSCYQCNGTAATNCIRCSTGKFLYWNGTCQSSCPSPLVTTTVGEDQYCNLPCGSNYLYENSTWCGSSCVTPTPFVPSTSSLSTDLKYCNFTCTSASQYLYWNNSCYTGCAFPLVNVTQGVERYCKLPCSGTQVYYLNNNTCQASCQYPYVQNSSGDFNYCVFMCNSSQYLYWNGTCQSTCPSPLVNSTVGGNLYCNLPCGSNYVYENSTWCGSSCVTPTPFVSSTSSISSDLKYCNFKCTSASQYLYWNNSCYTGCAFPLVNVTQGVERYCKLPCSGSQVYYLKNNTCQASCQYPYVEKSSGDFRYCEFKCSSSEYLYWNGTCLPTCPTSYRVISGTEMYCNKYCPTNQLLSSSNSTCVSSCDSPLVQTADAESYKTCSLPCPSGKYLYPDYSCQTSCAYLSSTNQDGILLCKYPCGQNSFLYENNTCLSNCTAPYVQMPINSNLSLCNSPCTSPQIYLPSNSSCVTQCDSPLVALYNGTLHYCGEGSTNTTAVNTTTETNSTSSDLSENGMVVLARGIRSFGDVLRRNTPNSGFIFAIVKLVKYIRYMDIPIHQDIRKVLDTDSPSRFSFASVFNIPMPNNLKQQFTTRRLTTELYDEQSNHSTYIVNHWENLVAYLILLLLGLIFTNVEKIAKKFNKRTFTLIVKRLRIITRWNSFLFVLFNTFDDLTLFAAFEFKNGIASDSFAIIFSFLTCIAMSIFALYMLGKVLYISKDAIKSKTQLIDSNHSTMTPEILFYKKWEDYQILYAGYKNTSLLSQGFLFFFTCRIMIVYLFVGFCEAYPVVQALFFTLLSVMMLIYLFKVRPMKERFCLIANFIFEILILMTNLFVLLLAAADATESLSFKSQYGLSMAILVNYLFIEILGNVFAWGLVFFAMWTAYKAGKKYGLSGKTSWLNVLVAPFKDPGLAFSEISNQEFQKSASLPNLEEPAPRTRADKKKPSWINVMNERLAKKLGLKKTRSRISPSAYMPHVQGSSVSDAPDKSDNESEIEKDGADTTPRLALNQKSSLDIESDGQPGTSRILLASPPTSPLSLPEPLSTGAQKGLEQKGQDLSSSPLSLSSTLYSRRTSSFGLNSLGQHGKKVGSIESPTLGDSNPRRKSLFGSQNDHDLNSHGLRATRNGSDTLSLARHASEKDAPSFIAEEAYEDTPAKLTGNEKAFAFPTQDNSPAVPPLRKDTFKEGDSDNLELYMNPESTQKSWLMRKSLTQRRGLSREISNPFGMGTDSPKSTKALIQDINSRMTPRLNKDQSESMQIPDSPAYNPNETFSPDSSLISINEDDKRRQRKSVISDLFFQPARMLKTKIWAVDKVAEMRRQSLASVPMPRNLGEAWKES